MRRRAARLALLAGAGLALAGLTIWVVAGSLTLSGSPCGNPPPSRGPIPPAVMVATCVAAFGLGRLAGLLTPVATARLASWPPSRTPGMVATQLLLVAFLGLVAALLAYETVALANPTRLWPITFYVRCAEVVAPGRTLIGAAAVSFVLGHWLWFPPREAE